MSSAVPKISVICTCFNHAPFVLESIQSVLNQSYENYELIVVDDGSTDGSGQVIKNFVQQNPQIRFIDLKTNQGICKAFNTALKVSTGDFLIDLAADDILLPDRLKKGIEAFHNCGEEVGVVFSDAAWIDERGAHLFYHSEKYPHTTIPQGNVYKDLIERYFICSPTMMFRRSVIEKLAGYDENLTYEDFDFWIRSSRIFEYRYDPEVLVKKRKLKNSLSHHQFKIFSKHNVTTYKVCNKILALNKTKAERNALKRRIVYEIRQCLRTLDFSLAYQYLLLWHKNNSLQYHD